MQLKLLMLFLLIIPSLAGIAHGHTIDSVGEYRVEIGWMNEPVVSGETNAIEFNVSPLISCPEIPEAIKCAESQEFKNGIPDLKKTIKIKLILVIQLKKMSINFLQKRNENTILELYLCL